MRILAVLACAVLMAAAAVPASAHSCGWGRCAFRPHAGAPRVHIFVAKGCCRAPTGWGFYRRQKLHHDCAAPLVVVDELGGVTLVRDRR